VKNFPTTNNGKSREPSEVVAVSELISSIAVGFVHIQGMIRIGHCVVVFDTPLHREGVSNT
jgi:hypothetical protein